MAENQSRVESLFAEFPSATPEEWEERIRKDLKGADFEKKMIWQSGEGFAVRPFYTRADLSGIAESFPGQYPFVRGYHGAGNSWELRQDIACADPKRANQLALAALRHGAEGVGFVRERFAAASGIVERGLKLDAPADLQTLLAEVWIDQCGLFFDLGADGAQLYDWLLAEFARRSLQTTGASVRIAIDPARDLLREGRLAADWATTMQSAAQIAARTQKESPGWRTLSASNLAAHWGGANLSQELAITLSAAHELLVACLEAGLTPAQFSSVFFFRFAVGQNYFMEIARLRAARKLWSRIVREYAGEDYAAASAFVVAESSAPNQAIYDRHNNLLRSNIEAMAALVGGCDSFSCAPFDAFADGGDEFSLRLALNTQLLLRHEAHLDKTADPAAGSYYLESLTDLLSRRSWEIFREIESAGGLAAAAAKGAIQRMVGENRSRLQEQIASRRKMVLGVNQYPNQKDAALQLDQGGALRPAPAVQSAVRIEALPEFRPAHAIEELRLLTERAAQRGKGPPVVFPWLFGDRTMRTARSNFVQNFFGCAGFICLDNPAYETPAEAAKAAEQAHADIIVFCAADADYAEHCGPAIAAARALLPAANFVVAGMPEAQIEPLKAAGVSRFVHVRTPLLSELQEYQRLLGLQA